MAHNSIYRGAYLGSISSLNEYLAFRSAHGIDDGSYKDLYIGDYFTIMDGTYNVAWVVAHFDYYENIGTNTSYGVTLVSYQSVTKSGMASTNSTVGGYKNSIAHNTVCPAIATALQTVLGSYLRDFDCIISREVNANISSMAGALDIVL